MHKTRRNPESLSPEKLRILQLIPSFGVGGAEQMAGHLILGLAQAHEVVAACFYRPLNDIIEQRLAQANIPIWHLDKRHGFDRRMFSALDKLLKRVRPHVVHTHLYILRYLFPVLLRRSVPVVVHTLHNLAEHETDTLGRMLQWIAFRRNVIPVVISEECAASFERVYGIKRKGYIPNCIPIENYSDTPEDRFRFREQHGFGRNDTLFVCVGRLEPQKNPLLLVEALTALRGTNAHLLLLGEGTLKNEIAAFAAAQGVAGQVHLLGKLNNVPEYLVAADAFVLGSDWEGNPLAVMEAMAAGLPVIGTAVGGVPELVKSGEEGILVPPRDVAAFSDSMIFLRDHPDVRLAMGNAARTRAHAEFSLDRMVQGYETLYRSALATSRHFPPSLHHEAGNVLPCEAEQER